MGREYIEWLKESAFLEYKSYPNHIGHWNPESPEYLESSREEHTLKSSVDGYNSLIDEFKTNIKLQEELYDMIDTMDRPYLRGTAGLDKNVYDEVKDYSKPVGHNQPNNREWTQDMLAGDSNIHRWVSNTPFIPKMTPLSNELEWEEVNDNRPINPAYNKEKGFKFDVPVPYSERVPHVADRLGFPEQLGSPLERLFHLEHDLMHPQYLDQPFVQTPSPNVDSSLSFQEGEVVYENARIAEWNKFILFGGQISAFLTGAYIPYTMFFHSSIPWAIQTEGVPGIQYFEHSLTTFDTYNGMSALMLPCIAVSWTTAIRILHDTVAPYATKVQYNTDQELLFVWFTDITGKEVEHVYEMEHLEILPPSVKGGVQFLSSQDKDGLIMVTDMNKGKNFYLYKEAIYWNPALKAKFMERTTRLWDDSVWDNEKHDIPNPEFDQKVLQIE